MTGADEFSGYVIDRPGEISSDRRPVANTAKLVTLPGRMVNRGLLARMRAKKSRCPLLDTVSQSKQQKKCRDDMQGFSRHGPYSCCRCQVSQVCVENRGFRPGMQTFVLQAFLLCLNSTPGPAKGPFSLISVL